jgi:nitroreductase
MELLAAIASRRSVRAYAPRPVDRPTIERLIGTAVLAPNAINAQPWAFGVIEGAERLREYSSRAKAYLLDRMAASPQLEGYRDRLADPAFNIFYGAPALIVVYARGSVPYAAGDSCMAAYTLMLAAHDAGLGTCWIGFAEPLLQTEEVKRELGVPADCQAVAPLILGYPVGEAVRVPRNPPQILFWKQ